MVLPGVNNMKVVAFRFLGALLIVAFAMGFWLWLNHKISNAHASVAIGASAVAMAAYALLGRKMSGRRDG